MKRRILKIFAVILIVTAISLVIYPQISNHALQEKNKSIINRFDDVSEDVQETNNYEAAVEDGVINDDGYLIDDSGEVVSNTPVVFQADLDRLYADSSAYNEALKKHQDMKVDFSNAALDLSNYGIFDGVFGYIQAPAIDLNVPIYLGASDTNMSWGGTHLMNTSLPIGGKGTNTVIAGHTGYIGRVVFDNLPSLSIGDTVSVTTYFGKLDYRVISKKEIGATETNDLYIMNDKDLLTLLTCARYGTARYEVICERA